MADPLVVPGVHEKYHIELRAEGLEPFGSSNPHTQPMYPAPGAALIWAGNTMHQLGLITLTSTGSILLNHLLNETKGGWVRIVPFNPFKNSSAYLWDHLCNAETYSEPFTSGARKYLSKIKYTPDRYFVNSFCRSHLYSDTESNRGTLPHEILFHELVHSYRAVSGKRNKQELHGALYQYENNEEFYAVLVTNIFISDSSNHYKTGLRHGHVSHAALEKDLASSFDFFRGGTQVYDLIDQFASDHKKLAEDLSNVKAPFNPLKAYRSNKHKARQLSHSTTAQERDVMGVLHPLFF